MSREGGEVDAYIPLSLKTQGFYASSYKDWEAVDIKADLCPPQDVVFASYSRGMKDIRTSIRKMIDISSGYVYLYWFAGDTHWDIHSQKLWPILHGCEYRQSPKAEILYNDSMIWESIRM